LQPCIRSLKADANSSPIQAINCFIAMIAGRSRFIIDDLLRWVPLRAITLQSWLNDSSAPDNLARTHEKVGATLLTTPHRWV
jgi:hypothetical protein